MASHSSSLWTGNNWMLARLLIINRLHWLQVHVVFRLPSPGTQQCWDGPLGNCHSAGKMVVPTTQSASQSPKFAPGEFPIPTLYSGGARGTQQ